MRTVVAIAAFLIIVLLPVSALAWSLVCAPQAGVVFYDIEVNGVVVETNFAAQLDGSVLYNIDHLSPGPVTFRLLPKDISGWGGTSWSVPFVAKQPASSSGIGIIE